MTNRGATARKYTTRDERAINKNTDRERISQEDQQMTMIQKKTTVGVPCAATGMVTRAIKASEEMAQTLQGFIDRIGGRSITPKEEELRQAILEKSNIVKEWQNMAYQEQLVAGMKEVCDKILRKYGKTTDKEDANICRE